jgi:hypothetical protein
VSGATGRPRPNCPSRFDSIVPWWSPPCFRTRQISARRRPTSPIVDPLSAFTFNLDHPQWPLLTVFIVAQPQNEPVLAKSFYRIIGNLVSATVPSGGLPR